MILSTSSSMPSLIEAPTARPTVASRQPAPSRLLASIANLPLETWVTPVGGAVGAKHPAQISERLGGAAFNGLAATAPNRVRSLVIATQPRGPVAERCRQIAAAAGLDALMIEREDDDPAWTVVLPNCHPGAKDLYVQRSRRPLTRAELASQAEAIRPADALIVGPMVAAEDETLNMLALAPTLTPQAYHALLPHPTLVAHPRFAEVARAYDYVQMNAAEARVLEPKEDLNDLANGLRRLLGEDREFAITNGAQPGLLWSEHAWWLIVPPAVEVVSDVGSGDVFCSAWVIARGLHRAGAFRSLAYALTAVAAAIGKARVRPFEP